MLFQMPDAVGNLFRKTGEGKKEWHYSWNAAGMLSQVIRPDEEAVTFTYDALGRRLSKSFRGKTTRWVWDGNTPLHEWVEQADIVNAAKQVALQAGANGGHQPEALVTWLFEPESFAPLAKLTKAASYDIVSDHLGTPLSMHGATGEAVWSADLNGYGEVLNLRGKAEDCPFRDPGQYEDVETGLYYNRFRYYDPNSIGYISWDPLRMNGGFNLYSYVHDPFMWIDPYGLSCQPIGGKITGYTKHGLNQAIGRNGGRGVSAKQMLDAVKNPKKVIEQANGTTRYVGKNANVILNKEGKVVSTWGKPRGPQIWDEGTKRASGSGSAQRIANQRGFSYNPKAIR